VEITNRKLVMLVDDEEDIRTVLGITLTDMGYKVLEAENGEEALKTFRKEKPVIVLTDIKMPCMDGIEVLKIIKRESPHTQVIMITGHGDTDIAIESLKYEAVDFITKPISSDSLEIALKRANEKILNREQLKKYTENLEELLHEKTVLKDNLSSLGVMIGSISHGVKGLLTKLDAGLYLIESGLKKDEGDRLTEGVDILKLTTTRIKKMILDILYYSKERKMKIENIDLTKFVNDVVDIAEQRSLPYKIDILRKFSGAPSLFKADSEKIRSALINVLDNAVDACIEDKTKEIHSIVFTVREDKKNIIFEIHDNGTGMDKKTRDRIFDLFFSSKQSQGTGFGLFISKNIIHEHGGFINVKSARGKGTCINIKIPKS
jgi:signal transduction histidine kinase